MSTVKKPPPNLLSEADKIAFDAYVQKWQGKLSLADWRFVRSLKKTKELAQIQMWHKDRLASYRIGSDFGSAPVTPASLEATALHEVLHTFVAELVNQISYGITGEVLDSAEHRVVNTLTTLLLKDNA